MKVRITIRVKGFKTYVIDAPSAYQGSEAFYDLLDDNNTPEPETETWEDPYVTKVEEVK